jgi:hypothetical protein
MKGEVPGFTSRRLSDEAYDIAGVSWFSRSARRGELRTGFDGGGVGSDSAMLNSGPSGALCRFHSIGPKASVLGNDNRSFLPS